MLVRLGSDRIKEDLVFAVVMLGSGVVGATAVALPAFQDRVADWVVSTTAAAALSMVGSMSSCRVGGQR